MIKATTRWHGKTIPREAAIEAAAIVIEAQVAEVTPIDLGWLKGSITYLTGGTQSTPRKLRDAKDKMSGTAAPGEAWVGTNAEYALYVEAGTSKMQPQSYLVRGAEESKAQAFAAFERVLKRAESGR